MFYNATSFNCGYGAGSSSWQSTLNGVYKSGTWRWDVSNVENMTSMFENASSYTNDQYWSNLGLWNINSTLNDGEGPIRTNMLAGTQSLTLYINGDEYAGAKVQSDNDYTPSIDFFNQVYLLAIGYYKLQRIPNVNASYNGNSQINMFLKPNVSANWYLTGWSNYTVAWFNLNNDLIFKRYNNQTMYYPQYSSGAYPPGMYVKDVVYFVSLALDTSKTPGNLYWTPDGGTTKYYNLGKILSPYPPIGSNMGTTLADYNPEFNYPLSDLNIASVVDSWFNYLINPNGYPQFSDSTNQPYYGNITTWQTQNVTNMSNLFENRDLTNSDISPWDTSSVTNITDMFKNASNYSNYIKTQYVTINDSTGYNYRYQAWNIAPVIPLNNTQSLILKTIAKATTYEFTMPIVATLYDSDGNNISQGTLNAYDSDETTATLIGSSSSSNTGDWQTVEYPYGEKITLVYITVEGNDNITIYFKYVSPISTTQIDIDGNIEFVENSIQYANINDPTNLNVNATISNTYLTSSVSANDTTQLDTFQGWLGTLTTTNCQNGYLIYVNIGTPDDSLLEIIKTGYPASVTDTKVFIEFGWNLIGFPSDVERDIQNVFTQPLDGDILIDVNTNLSFQAEQGIYGVDWDDQLELEPKYAYKYLSTGSTSYYVDVTTGIYYDEQGNEFNNTTTSSLVNKNNKPTLTLMSKLNVMDSYEVDKNIQENSMQLVFRIEDDENKSIKQGTVVAIDESDNNKPHGRVEVNSNTILQYMTIHSNTEGIPITFKYISNNIVYDTTQSESITFVTNETLGAEFTNQLIINVLFKSSKHEQITEPGKYKKCKKCRYPQNFRRSRR
jgi:hypothetical protein